MELRQLKYFSVLAKELNFSRAAEILCITQGTLSQQIKQLEAEIGSDLFERSSHSVALTETGSELVRYAVRTLNDAHECSQVAADLKKGLTGTLNIGVTHSFKYFLRNTVKDFIKSYPGIKLTITYSTANDLLSLLRNRKIDFFVAFKPDEELPDIEYVNLFESQLAIIMRKGHPLSSKTSLTKEEFSRHPVALPSTGLQSRRAVDRFVGIDKTKMNVSLETNDPNILLEIVSSTNLLSITSTLAIGYRDDLISVPLDGIDKKMVGCIHHLKNTYIKKSASLFTKMMADSAELERIAAL